jgi:hypothetical protein
VSYYCLGFFTYRKARSQEDKDNLQKNGLGYTIMKKLLEIGGYLNKGYSVFVSDYFMSIPLVHHHHLSTYITGTVRRNRKLLPQQFKNKFAIGQKMYCRSGPLLTFSASRNHKQKILSFFSPATPQPKKRKYGEDMVAIHK